MQTDPDLSEQAANEKAAREAAENSERTGIVIDVPVDNESQSIPPSVPGQQPFVFSHSPEVQSAIDQQAESEAVHTRNRERLNAKRQGLIEKPVDEMSPTDRKKIPHLSEDIAESDVELIRIQQAGKDLESGRVMREAITELSNAAAGVPVARSQVEVLLETVSKYKRPNELDMRGCYTQEMVVRHEIYRAAADRETFAYSRINSLENKIKHRDEVIAAATERLERYRSRFLGL